MKRLLTIALLALTSLAFGATTTPVSLLNPSGSTAGQAIISTGASSAPVWGAVPLTGITGTLAISNGGTGATSAANARTNLGLGTSATVNTGTSGATIPLLNGANTWAAAQTFSVRPTFNGATPYDTANLTIANYQTKAGATDGSNASAGQIGEYLTNSTTGTSLTTATAANLTSVSLTAGDWDVQCTAQFNPAASTVLASAFVGVSTTSATFGSLGSSTLFRTTVIGSSGVASLGETLASPVVRVSVSSTTTVYCVGQSSFSTSTMTGDGFIRARRVR